MKGGGDAKKEAKDTSKEKESKEQPVDTDAVEEPKEEKKDYAETLMLF